MCEHFRIEDETNKLSDDVEDSEDMQFIQNIAYKNVIYDPLDRAVINQEDKPQSTSTKDFKKLIQECKAAKANNFNAPFNQNAYFLLYKLIDSAMASLLKFIEEQIKLAKEQGEKYTLNIEESGMYVQIKMCLDYLHELALLADTGKLLSKLTVQTKKWKDLIQQAKLYKSMGDLDKEMFDKLQQLDEYSNKKESTGLAKVLIGIDQLIQKLKTQSKV